MFNLVKSRSLQFFSTCTWLREATKPLAPRSGRPLTHHGVASVHGLGPLHGLQFGVGSGLTVSRQAVKGFQLSSPFGLQEAASREMGPHPSTCLCSPKRQKLSSSLADEETEAHTSSKT